MLRLMVTLGFVTSNLFHQPWALGGWGRVRSLVHPLFLGRPEERVRMGTK